MSTMVQPKKDAAVPQTPAAIDKWLETVPVISLLQWLGRGFNPLMLSAAISTVDCPCGRTISEPLELALQIGVARPCPECRKTPFLRHEVFGERMRRELHPRLNVTDTTIQDQLLGECVPRWFKCANDGCGCEWSALPALRVALGMEDCPKCGYRSLAEIPRPDVYFNEALTPPIEWQPTSFTWRYGHEYIFPVLEPTDFTFEKEHAAEFEQLTSGVHMTRQYHSAIHSLRDRLRAPSEHGSIYVKLLENWFVRGLLGQERRAIERSAFKYLEKTRHETLECILAPASQFLAPKGEGGVELYAGKTPIPRLTVLSAFAGELKIVNKVANREWQHAFELPGDYVANIKDLKEDDMVIIDATEMRSEAIYARMVNLDPEVRYNAEFVVVEVNKRMPVVVLVATTDIRAHDEIVVRNPQSHIAVTQRTPWHRLPLSTEGSLPIIFTDPAHAISSPIAMDSDGAKNPAEARARGKKRAEMELARPGAKRGRGDAATLPDLPERLAQQQAQRQQMKLAQARVVGLANPDEPMLPLAPLEYTDGSHWFYIRPPTAIESQRKNALDPRAVYDSILEELKVKRAFAAAGGIRRGELAQYLTDKLKAKNKDQVVSAIKKLTGDAMDESSGPPYIPEPGQAPNILVRQEVGGNREYYFALDLQARDESGEAAEALIRLSGAANRHERREGSQGFDHSADEFGGGSQQIVQTPLGKFTMEDIGAMSAEKFEQLLQASTQAQAKEFLSVRRRARNNAASRKYRQKKKQLIHTLLSQTQGTDPEQEVAIKKMLVGSPGPAPVPGSNQGPLKVEFISGASAEEEMKARIAHATRSITLMINAPISANVLDHLERRLAEKRNLRMAVYADHGVPDEALESLRRIGGEIKKGRIKSEYSAYDQESALLGPQRSDRTMVLQTLHGSVQVMQLLLETKDAIMVE